MAHHTACVMRRTACMVPANGYFVMRLTSFLLVGDLLHNSRYTGIPTALRSAWRVRRHDHHAKCNAFHRAYCRMQTTRRRIHL